MTKNLIKKTTYHQDFVQDLEVGTVDSLGDLSITAFDQFDLENYIEAVEYSWRDEKTITVRVPADQVKQFERGQMYLTVIAIQEGRVTNPINCQVDISF